MGQSSDDVLVSILLLLDWDSLLQASRVCKEWRSLIRSPEFRAGWWCQKNIGAGSLLLISAYNFSREHHPRPQQLLVWSPSSPSTPPLPLPPWMNIPLPSRTFDIVASSHGLIAARHPSWSDRHTPGVEFTVGNPVTNQWVRIPRLKHQKWAGRLYNLVADPASGDFWLVDWCNMRIYESSSRSWRRMNAGALDNPLLLDMDPRGLVRLKEPLQDNESFVGCASFVWEHGGKRYAAWASEGRRIMYRVWSLEEGGDEGGDRVYVPRELARWEVDGSNKVVYVDYSVVIECTAGGDLVCFTGQCRDYYDLHRFHNYYDLHCIEGKQEPMPVVVYDLERHQWFQVPGSEGLHHRRAVVYRPSLVTPSGASSAPQFGDGEFLWHKRRREEQPDLGDIRRKRTRAFAKDSEMDEDFVYINPEMEMREDVFYL